VEDRLFPQAPKKSVVLTLDQKLRPELLGDKENKIRTEVNITSAFKTTVLNW